MAGADLGVTALSTGARSPTAFACVFDADEVTKCLDQYTGSGILGLGCYETLSESALA